MIIAMPNNQVVHRSDPQHADQTFTLFDHELRQQIMPLVDKAYSTQPGPHGRAIAGLSMGGRHAQLVGFKALDLFASFGILSAGDPASETSTPQFLTDPDINKKVDYLLVGLGTHENQPTNRSVVFHQILDRHASPRVRHRRQRRPRLGHVARPPGLHAAEIVAREASAEFVVVEVIPPERVARAGEDAWLGSARIGADMKARTIWVAMLAAAASAGAVTGQQPPAPVPSAAPTVQAGDTRPLHVYIRSGLKTHGEGAHDYPQFSADWSKLLTDKGALVDGSFHFPSAQELANTDVMVMYKGDAGYMTASERQVMEDYLKRGGGLISIHDTLCGDDPHTTRVSSAGPSCTASATSRRARSNTPLSTRRRRS